MLKHSLLGLALAATAGVAVANDLHRTANRHVAWTVGAQHLDYTEIDEFEITSDHVLNTERGAQPLMRGTFSYQGNFAGFNNAYFRFEASTAQGKTRRHGYLQNFVTEEPTPYANTTKNRFYDYSLRIGHSFSYVDDPSWQFTPYISFAHRHWVREPAKPCGYRRDYEHQDAGVGLLSQWADPAGLMVVSVDAGYSQIIEARMGVLEEQSKLPLGTKGSFSATLSLDITIGQNGHLLAGYHFKKFKYGTSGVVNDILGPPSKSKQQQLFLGYAVSY